MSELCIRHQISALLPSGGQLSLRRPFTGSLTLQRRFTSTSRGVCFRSRMRCRCVLLLTCTSHRKFSLLLPFWGVNCIVGLFIKCTIARLFHSEMCRSQMSPSQRLQPVRRAAAAAVLALLAVTCQGRAVALEADSAQARSDASSSGAPTPIYFGNGCFWGRQKDYIDAEKSMGRSKSDLSAVVGYAGGRKKGKSRAVCLCV